MSNASLATSPETDSAIGVSNVHNSGLLPHLQQALDMLDLAQEQELERFRRYKNGELKSTGTVTPDQYTKPLVNMTEEEEDEEEYEIIPPSEPFAVYKRRTDEPMPASARDYQAPGEMVLTGQLQEEASLDLSFVPPGEMTSARDEYLPASQELWRSLGQPQIPLPPPIPKWKMPVAIGSVLMAITTIGGMSYVNQHPALLKGIPMVAQMIEAPALPAIPPGQSLQGPDLAMGEFSDLNLSNINALAVSGSEVKVATAPTTTPVVPPQTPMSAALPPSAALLAQPSAVTTTPAIPEQTSARLADSLMRNLLPPNIQQMAGSSAPASSAQPPASAKPDTPNQLYYQPPVGILNQPRYAVIARYVNPLGLVYIQSFMPQAVVEGNKINLGSFPRQSAALDMVKQLRQKGVKAWVTKQ